MITPKLEELILCGKAFFKTFVAGGDKHTLTFGNDRFIIITDITYFPGFNESEELNYNTQVAIYGERGYNHFIFRNIYIPEVGSVRVHSAVTINTFILHDQQVGFSFCNAPFLNNNFLGIANTNNPGYAPPLDFGIDGQPGALPITLTADAVGTTAIQNNFTTRPAAGVNESQQVFFPFDANNQLYWADNPEFPLLHVNYVEVLGSSNNIQI
jgi:hypothetical protein